jgi:hypothetical protein
MMCNKWKQPLFSDILNTILGCFKIHGIHPKLKNPKDLLDPSLETWHFQHPHCWLMIFWEAIPIAPMSAYEIFPINGFPVMVAYCHLYPPMDSLSRL